jgi:hypothetical protein
VTGFSAVSIASRLVCGDRGSGVWTLRPIGIPSSGRELKKVLVVCSRRGARIASLVARKLEEIQRVI